MIQRRPALLAGSGLFLMAVVAPILNFGLLPGLAQGGGHEAYGLVAVGFVAVAVLDLMVTWSLYEAFAPSGRATAGWAALFRGSYSVLFLVAISHLGAPQYDVAAFQAGWSFALLVFGLHLVAVGVSVAQCGHRTVTLGVVVGLAGLGYLFDSVAKQMLWTVGFSLSDFTFVGEVLLMGWLLWVGLRRASAGKGAT